MPDALLNDALRAQLERRLALRAGHDASALMVSATEALLGEAFVAAFGTAARAGAALFAQGGLARRDLTPFADVDLLLVLLDDTPQTHARAEAFFRSLWDRQLRIGHAVRTPHDVEQAVRAEPDAATALLEARWLVGERELGKAALADVRRRALPSVRASLLSAKLEEIDARRTKYGARLHLVEPNVKGAPGGLRDIHAVLWLGLLHAPQPDPDGHPLRHLLRQGHLFEREVDQLVTSWDQLLALRAALHLVAGRGEDRLLFEHQEPAARLLGYTETSEETASQQMMRGYFEVARKTRHLLSRIRERMTTHRARLPRFPRREYDEGFTQRGKHLFVTDADLFRRHPTRTIDLVRIAASNGLFIGPRTRALTREALDALPGGALFDDAEAGRALHRLAASQTVRGSPFTTLLEKGVFSAILRDMHRLSGRFRADGYHAYTTDAHLCLCADLALQAVSGALPAPPPLRDAMKRLERSDLLVLAAFFHDIGKGLGGDHALKGEAIVRSEASRMGLPAADVDTLAFLVREHLVLSSTSQRRDLSDPSVLNDLASVVQTPARLDLLTLLTWVDIAAVAPGMFNDWKAQLLGAALTGVREMLLGDWRAAEADDDATFMARIRDQMDASISDALLQRFVAGIGERGRRSGLDEGLAGDARVFALYCERNANLSEDAPVGDVAEATKGGEHVYRVVARDRAGLLSDLASTFESEGATILAAHVDTRTDGVAIDRFRVERSGGGPLDPVVAEQLRIALEAAALGGVERVHLAPQKRTGPQVNAKVRALSGLDSYGATIFEVRCRDRPGVVAAIAQTFTEAGWQVALAKIHTDGDVARDTFWVVPTQEHWSTERTRRALLAALTGDDSASAPSEEDACG